MRKVMLDEIRHLKPSLRLAMLEGRTQYHDQQYPVEVEDAQIVRLQKSGQLPAGGGQSYSALDSRLMLRDTLVRAPNVSSQR